jgi:hypothetical protein
MSGTDHAWVAEAHRSHRSLGGSFGLAPIASRISTKATSSSPENTSPATAAARGVRISRRIAPTPPPEGPSSNSGMSPDRTPAHQQMRVLNTARARSRCRLDAMRQASRLERETLLRERNSAASVPPCGNAGVPQATGFAAASERRRNSGLSGASLPLSRAKAALRARSLGGTLSEQSLDRVRQGQRRRRWSIARAKQSEAGFGR